MSDLIALSESKNFCILPWLHVHVLANGDAHPCCVSTDPEPLGNFNTEKNIESLWNSKRMRELRLRMLNDEPSVGCKKCQFSSAKGLGHSFRSDMNEVFSKYLPLVESTAPDGSVEKFKMTYFDTRFSNLCNMKCRTCSPTFSSSWHEDAQKLYGDSGNPKVISVDSETSESYWRAIEPHLNEVEFVNFAGGEPFLMPENLKMLEHWIANKKTQMLIRYTTNFSHISANPRIFELWKHFPDIKINASLDASGARAEYLRKGTQWNKIIENVATLRRQAPHVKLEVSSTISAFNAWHVPDFHREWITAGVVEPRHFHVNMLTDPHFMSAQILPPAFKNEIAEKFESALAEFSEQHDTHRLAREYKKVADFLRAQDANEVIPQFLTEVKKVDQLRKENFAAAFPELSILES